MEREEGMGRGGGGGEERAMAAREWLESLMARVDGASTTAAEFAGSKAGNFDAIAMWGLKVLHVGGGRALCSLCVPKFLTVSLSLSLSLEMFL